jgi:mono/diheme cytochrome c family protein
MSALDFHQIMVGLIERNDNEMIRKSSLVFVIQRTKNVLSVLVSMSALVFSIAPVVLAQAELGQVATNSSDDAVWEVPADARAVENPIASSPEAEEEGAKLYGRYCSRCHGDIGKGDGMAVAFILPAPKDITTIEIQERMTDGEIFYKITEGKTPMPGMGKRLSEDERWKIVHFVRTLKVD